MTSSNDEARERLERYSLGNPRAYPELHPSKGGVNGRIRADLRAVLASLPPKDSSGDARELAADVVQLVIAAREVVFSDGLFDVDPDSCDALRHLDRAAEVFASRVPWPDEPGYPATSRPRVERAWREPDIGLTAAIGLDISIFVYRDENRTTAKFGMQAGDEADLPPDPRPYLRRAIAALEAELGDVDSCPVHALSRQVRPEGVEEDGPSAPAVYEARAAYEQSRAEALAALGSQDRPAPDDKAIFDDVREQVRECALEGIGFWRSCSGCYETNEGYPTAPDHPAFGCALGGGCSECGGIGAVWDTTDYGAMADDMQRDDASRSAPDGWALTEDMEAAGKAEWIRGGDHLSIFRAMVAASPSALSGEGVDHG